ncbi:hypothetical protein NE865_01794 [Phthorimaea operculella]|nr:hypothetical protein NE865_01794 [Phthorimaea operculella]
MNQTNIPISKSEMSLDTKLASLAPLVSNRASEHNVFTTYVCLVKDGLSRHLHQGNSGQATDVEQATSTEEDFDGNANAAPIQVERSKAVHELIEAVKNTDHNIIQGKPPDIILEDSEVSDQDENNSYDNPKKLKLTKMKWLSEDQNGYLDSSSPSVSSIKSTTSSKESDNEVKEEPDIGEKCLSTILRLDKEHNLFGLSSITIVGSKQLKPKQKGKDDEKPVFHQTAIVQVCKSTCSKCCQPGCKNRSKSDLPCSLKYSSCGSCVSCCSRTCTSVPCTQPCYPCPKPYKPCRKPSYLRRKPSKTCPKPCYPYPKPCYPYPKSCDPYPKSCYPYPKSCYPYPKPCYPTKSCHPYPKSCYPYPKPCYPTKSCYPYPKSCYLYSKSCYPCPRPCSPPLKRPCLSSCVTCLVAPPSCALIPRTPKIHAACLPDTPMFPLETFKVRSIRYSLLSTARCPYSLNSYISRDLQVEIRN